MAENGLDEGAVRAHVDAVAASAGFVNADRLTRFLRFTVEAKLRGEGGQIKEFLLGREVFDRGGDYDPRLDPIVRVEARRLRQRLDEYYAGPGRGEGLRIEFPKGGYAPVIHAVTLASAPVPVAAPVRRLRYWQAAAAALAIVLAGTAIWLYSRRPVAGASLAVVPARWVWNGAEALDPGDEALAERITAEIANRGRTSVAGWPLVQRYRGVRREVREIGAGLGVARVLIVAVRLEESRRRVTVFLLDAASGRKSWVREWTDPNPGEIAAALP